MISVLGWIASLALIVAWLVADELKDRRELEDLEDRVLILEAVVELSDDELQDRFDREY